MDSTDEQNLSCCGLSRAHDQIFVFLSSTYLMAASTRARRGGESCGISLRSDVAFGDAIGSSRRGMLLFTGLTQAWYAPSSARLSYRLSSDRELGEDLVIFSD
jgi:hypothetical protein